VQHFLSSTLTVEAANVELKAKGRTLVFDGFTRVRGANIFCWSHLTSNKLTPDQII
jgi:DNA topoisomerase IA